VVARASKAILLQAFASKAIRSCPPPISSECFTKCWGLGNEGQLAVGRRVDQASIATPECLRTTMFHLTPTCSLLRASHSYPWPMTAKLVKTSYLQSPSPLAKVKITLTSWTTSVISLSKCNTSNGLSLSAKVLVTLKSKLVFSQALMRTGTRSLPALIKERPRNSTERGQRRKRRGLKDRQSPSRQPGKTSTRLPHSRATKPCTT
jgi:hypothetical protein